MSVGEHEARGYIRSSRPYSETRLAAGRVPAGRRGKRPTISSLVGASLLRWAVSSVTTLSDMFLLLSLSCLYVKTVNDQLLHNSSTPVWFLHPDRPAAAMT